MRLFNCTGHKSSLPFPTAVNRNRENELFSCGDCSSFEIAQFSETCFEVEADGEDMGDAMPNVTAPSSGQEGWEWKADTQKWVESSGKPLFRVVPDDTKPTLRDPLSTSDPTETEHFILRPPPFNK